MILVDDFNVNPKVVTTLVLMSRYSQFCCDATYVPSCRAYVIEFVKKGLVRTIIDILKYHFEIFNSLYLKNARSSLCTFLH